MRCRWLAALAVLSGCVFFELPEERHRARREGLLDGEGFARRGDWVLDDRVDWPPRQRVDDVPFWVGPEGTIFTTPRPWTGQKGALDDGLDAHRNREDEKEEPLFRVGKRPPYMEEPFPDRRGLPSRGSDEPLPGR